jgi:hypothetical protein
MQTSSVSSTLEGAAKKLRIAVTYYLLPAKAMPVRQSIGLANQSQARRDSKGLDVNRMNAALMVFLGFISRARALSDSIQRELLANCYYKRIITIVHNRKLPTNAY